MTAVNGYIQPGQNLNYYNAGSAISYLDIIVMDNMVVVAADDIDALATGAVFSEGVFNFPAKTTDVVTFGLPLYWDAGNGYATYTPTGNTPIGIAAEAKDGSTTNVDIKLLPASVFTLIESLQAGVVAADSISNAELATDVKVGSLATLDTSAKTSVVAAINELVSRIEALETSS